MDNNQVETKEKKKKCQIGIKIYATVMTVLFIIMAIITALCYIEGTKEDSDKEEAVEASSDELVYSAKEVAGLIEAQREEIYDIAYEKGSSEALSNVLSEIKDKMSTGTTTLQMLRDLYPEYLIYNQVGGYVFGDILNLPKNSFKKDDFKINEETGILEYVGTESIKTYKTIDVSKFQGDIDWEKVKADGVEYVFIRVGLRGYGSGAIVDDEKFEDNIKGALKNDLKVGVYFFSEAINTEEAIEEAEYVLEKIKDYNVTLPVVMDIEEIPDDEARNEALTKEELTQVCIAFMERVKKDGYEPMLYGNIKCLVSMVDLEKMKDYDIWYAYYSDEIYVPYEVAGWQYSSTGKVDGISTDCDLNMFFKEWD